MMHIMKSLLILRHAKSSWSKPAVADHDRPLNDRGKRDTPRIGKLLIQQGLVPELIVSSTAKRARKTAKRVAKHCDYPGALELTADFYLGHADDYIQFLLCVSDEVDSVMVVGHNPGVEELLEGLTGQWERLPTGALAHVALDVSSWADVSSARGARLVAVWRPKELD
jgi:phosphohistidine phosphatase